MKFITAAAALFVATVANAQVSFTDCSINPTKFAISNFSMSPDPMCMEAEEVCFTATGTLSKPISEESQVTVFTSFMGHDVHGRQYDLCTLTAAQGNPCPIPITSTSVSFCVPTSTLATRLTFVYTVKATDYDQDIFCQAGNFTLINCT